MYKDKPILLVEDNPDDEELTLRALRKHNLADEVIVKRDGQEAIDFIVGSDAKRNGHSIPQLVLLDLKIPKIDGLQVLKSLRSYECTRYVPVVVLTSSNEEQDLISSYQLGANSYVRKPVNFHRFVDVAKQLGMYWLVLNEAPNA